MLKTDPYKVVNNMQQLRGRSDKPPTVAFVSPLQLRRLWHLVSRSDHILLTHTKNKCERAICDQNSGIVWCNNDKDKVCLQMIHNNPPPPGQARISLLTEGRVADMCWLGRNPTPWTAGTRLPTLPRQRWIPAASRMSTMELLMRRCSTITTLGWPEYPTAPSGIEISGMTRFIVPFNYLGMLMPVRRACP